MIKSQIKLNLEALIASCDYQTNSEPLHFLNFILENTVHSFYLIQNVDDVFQNLQGSEEKRTKYIMWLQYIFKKVYFNLDYHFPMYIWIHLDASLQNITDNWCISYKLEEWDPY